MKFFLRMCFLFLILSGCTKKAIIYDMPTEDLFKISKDAFDNKKYGPAIDGFKKLVFEHPGSEYIDEAQFFLAESYLNTKDYENAVVEYRFLIENFPESPYLDDASYRLGFAYFAASPPYYLEQTKTEDALKIIKKFVVQFPESEWIGEARKVEKKCFDKLSRKELENGKLYFKLGRFNSAEIYFLDILKSYPSSHYIDETKYTLALCYQKQSKNEEAKSLLQELLDTKGRFAEKAKKQLGKLR